MRHLYNNNQGMALVISLLIMAVAAMIGIGIATDSSIDGQISRNQRNLKKDFFIADGSNLVEVAKILASDPELFENKDFTKPQILADNSTDNSNEELPGMTTINYRRRISHLFRRFNLSGDSIDSGAFTLRYYTTKTFARRDNRNQTSIKTTERRKEPGAGTSGLY